MLNGRIVPLVAMVAVAPVITISTAFRVVFSRIDTEHSFEDAFPWYYRGGFGL